MKQLLVNEIFGPTIQGEGRSVGRPTSFLRLAACNLSCVWCDTPYTWNWENTQFEHPTKYKKEAEAHMMSIEQVVEQLRQVRGNTSRVVISGGEPLLQQEALVTLIHEHLHREDLQVEIETNGTIVPSDELLYGPKYYSISPVQFNCSPKLASSGADNGKHGKVRIVPEALGKITQTPAASFKFVIASDADMEEVLDIVKTVRIEPSRVYLMPEGRTKEEQEQKTSSVVDLCIKHGFNFSPRLHLAIWGSKRAV